MSKRAILVLGGAGYIGSQTCKWLEKAGYLPVVLDNLSTGHRWALKYGPFIEGDLADTDTVRAIVDKFQIQDVMHFAAKAYVGESMVDPGLYFRENIGKAIPLLDTLSEAGVQRFIFSSSCATYGEPQDLPMDESHPQLPINPYGETKMMLEKILHWYGRVKGLNHVILRYFNAAGADSDGELGEEHMPETHLIPRAIHASLGNGEPLEIYGFDYPTPDGTALRDYIHVEDLARAHQLSLEYLIEGNDSIAMNLGTGVPHSVLEIVSNISKVVGNEVPFHKRPRREGDPAQLVADGSLARTTLGWEPEMSDLGSIITTALKWHEKRAKALVSGSD